MPFTPPISLVNPLSLRAFNTLYWHRQWGREHSAISHYEPFFYPLDALAEWLLANGIDSTVTAPDWDRDDAMVSRLLKDPRSVGNISDAGAHGQMFCGAGDNIILFTQFVRERGELTVEGRDFCDMASEYAST